MGVRLADGETLRVVVTGGSGKIGRAAMTALKAARLTAYKPRFSWRDP
jgi:uncharacterized protein YbjT (DUF2867 family)